MYNIVFFAFGCIYNKQKVLTISASLMQHGWEPLSKISHWASSSGCCFFRTESDCVPSLCHPDTQLLQWGRLACLCNNVFPVHVLLYRLHPQLAKTTWMFVTNKVTIRCNLCCIQTCTWHNIIHQRNYLNCWSNCKFCDESYIHQGYYADFNLDLLSKKILKDFLHGCCIRLELIKWRLSVNLTAMQKL